MDRLLQVFTSSLQTGFIDKGILSKAEYHPELLVNQKNPPKKVLTNIIHELDRCEEFLISVAFVTTSGVASIINKLSSLESRGVKGKLLVSQYLNFTQPEALKRLLQFSNIDLRIATTGNAHAKGYIFKHNDHYSIIVGSSNLTAQALSTNKEWNIKVSALDESALVEKVINEFNVDFDNAIPVSKSYIDTYEEVYKKQLLFSKQSQFETIVGISNEVKPNNMQLDALRNLALLRAEDKKKALIISATGTGKTYLSAFDAKAFNPKKLLFVVHRLTIAKDSMDTFKTVFGDTRSMGLYSGNTRDLDCDFVFSTIQTISKSNHLENFLKDHFDYIIIDETHRSGADSYLRLLDYFEPKFLLGMTATPERTDGNDIFKLFDHNIAYEIRLQKAMEEDMLAPFHYYGVTDLMIDEQAVDDVTLFKSLFSNERVERIIEQANFYGTDNGIIRGLVFCSRKEEANELAVLFNQQGYKAVALTGDSSEEARAKAIERLESDILNEKLDYIFTVDIFNEGIDIPKINQIIMLRPTESAIIFIQQLGRGLRKVDGKGYLTVVDFIGNYSNNYLIPIALYGDTSYNKDSLRKLLTEGSRMIPGASTINFDEITKERIFKSIDAANMQLFADLKKDYNLLKFKLGRIPMMMDFIEHGSRDPFLYVDYSKSYFNFVKRVESDFEAVMPEQQIKLLELFSKEINNAKRVEESYIILLLIERGKLSISEFRAFIKNKYNYTVSNATIQSCIANLNFEFIRESKGKKLVPVRFIYNINIIKLTDDEFIFEKPFISYLNESTFSKYLLDSIRYSIFEFDKQFQKDSWREGFVLYRKYTRKDVFRILNVSENPVAQNVGGYLVSPDNTHCPIFVNYHKEDHISESTKYEDVFVNNSEFDWMSKSNRRLDSNDVQSIMGKNGKIRLPMFIKKNNDEGIEFYYMGDVEPELNQVEQTTMRNDSGNLLPVVKFRFNLDPPVITSMYTYLHENINESLNSKHLNRLIPLNPVSELQNPIPLYSFFAAAGTFSYMQENKDFTLIEGPANLNSAIQYFACKIIGESMNRVIPNGSICLFKEYSGGSRNGKIVLVENRDVQDQDFNSAFTIKTYISEVSVNEDSYKHNSIILRPNSFDSDYQDIRITEENAEEMRVVGEFVRIL
jgi:superfamily II DNA or RNA helicase/HKD family nuclease/phage repressor protein C with HTH and peptisase S24 domain